MSEQTFHLDWLTLFRVSPIPSAILDRSLTIVACNDAYEKVCGKRRDEIVGRPFFVIFSAQGADQRAIVKASCDYVWEHRRPHHIPLLDYHIDNDRRFWSVINTPISSADGRDHYLLIQPTNITELTRYRDSLNPLAPAALLESDKIAAEQASHRSEVQQILSAEGGRLEQLFQSAPGFICILRGPRHVYEMANDAHRQLVGDREVIGQEIAVALPEIIPQGFLEKLDKVYRTGIPFIGRAVPIDLQRTADAELEQVYVDLMYQPIHDATGRIAGIFVQGHDVTDAYRLSRKVAYQTVHDPLTGLANRRLLDDVSRQVEDDQGYHVLLYLDIDHFKIVNDRCGHSAGDELLIQIAEILTRAVRSEDLLARVGGDEFALLLNNCSELVALEVAKHLRNDVQELIFMWNSRRYGVSISIGLVVFGTHTNLSFSDALSLADSACFLAKEKGRNRIQVGKLDDEEIRRQQNDMDWASRIKEAIAEDHIVLWGQKIVPIAKSDDALYLEVLARLLDADADPIPPGAFIPAAERFGMVEQLDYHIVNKIFAVLASLPVTHRDVLLFVNLSGATLSSPEFAETITGLAKQYPMVSPHQICFEVTETSAITDLGRTSAAMTSLVSKGFTFALDDFGSGMSSFSYLEQLPVTYVKIDGEFIRTMESHIAGSAIVEAVTKVAGAMNIVTIAEYVERVEQIPLLRSLGVEWGQGFGLHKPQPIHELIGQ